MDVFGRVFSISMVDIGLLRIAPGFRHLCGDGSPMFNVRLTGIFRMLLKRGPYIYIYSVLCKCDMLTLNSHLSYIYIYILVVFYHIIIIHHVCPGQLGANKFHLVQPNKAWFVGHIPVVCCSQPIVHCCIVLLQ